MTDIAGGVGAEDFGSGSNLLLGSIVLATIVVLNLSRNTMIRLSSILVGLLVGWLVASMMGKASMADFSAQPLLSIPVPFKYGFAFDWQAFFAYCLYLFNYGYRVYGRSHSKLHVLQTTY